MKLPDFLFTVRKREDGTPWIAVRPNESDEEIGLELYRGTSIEEAKQLARFLNGNIKEVRRSLSRERTNRATS